MSLEATRARPPRSAAPFGDFGRGSIASLLVIYGVPLLLRALAIGSARRHGFWAISDDDFARVQLAQAFARDPQLDASGSSWLPFPFWLHGTVFRLFGAELNVARQLSEVLSLASVLGVQLAASFVGLRRRGIVLAGCLSAVLPYAVWLSTATVPDGYCAVLSVIALSSLCRSQPWARVLGACCVAAAAASRYDAWPIAALLGVTHVYHCFEHLSHFAPAGNSAKFADNSRVVSDNSAPAAGGNSRLFAGNLQRPALELSLFCAALSVSVPLLWLLHGALHHESALFFLKRVADYRRGIGQGSRTFVEVCVSYMRGALLAEPEILLGGLAVVVLRAVLGPGRGPLFPLGGLNSKRALSVLLHPLLLGNFALAAFLILGDLRDGAPTHHPERPLLLLWLTAVLLIASRFNAASDETRNAQPRSQPKALGRWLGIADARYPVLSGALQLSALLGAVLLGSVLRFGPIARGAYGLSSFMQRETEVSVGIQLSEVLGTERVFIDTGDYAYLAIEVALNRPGQSVSHNASDPRRSTPNVWRDAATFKGFIAEQRLTWIVTTTEHAAWLNAHGADLHREGRLAWGAVPSRLR